MRPSDAGRSAGSGSLWIMSHQIHYRPSNDDAQSDWAQHSARIAELGAIPPTRRSTALVPSAIYTGSAFSMSLAGRQAGRAGRRVGGQAGTLFFKHSLSLFVRFSLSVRKSLHSFIICR